MLRLRGDLIRASDNLIFAQLTNRGNERLFMKTKTSLTRNSISWSPLRHGLILNALALAFACFALAPQARAVCQDGCLGNQNTAVGFEALRSNNASSNTAVGYLSLTRCKGNSNIALGDSAGINIKQTDNNIDIGNTGVVGDSNTIRIGNETHTATYIAGISGAT